MKKMLLKFLVLTLTTGLLFIFNTGCKKNEDATDLIVTVIVGEGAEGTPDAGTYTHKENDVFTYDFTIKDKYMNLQVSLDGDLLPTSGTFTVSQNHRLEVSTEPEPGDFKLTVATTQGIAGTPERGTVFYNTGETLDYEYSLEDEYTNLRVILNGEDAPASGTLTFDQDHILQVLADKYFEIRGTWTIQEFYDDDSTFTVTLTFEGDEGTSGTVTDSDGGTGTYEVSGPAVKFNIDYPDVQYEYTGNFTSDDTMQGNSTRATPSNSFTGLWSASRDTSSTAAFRMTESGKGKVKIERKTSRKKRGGK